MHNTIYKRYIKLKKSTNENDREIYGFVEDAIVELRCSPVCGKKINNKKCGNILKDYGIANLRVLKLKNGWRLLYSLVSDQRRSIRVIIVFFGTHKEY